MREAVIRLRWALGAGTLFFLLTLGQALVIARLAPASPTSRAASTVAEAWGRLNNWDSWHYLSIARDGYVLPASTAAVPPVEPTSDDVHADRANLGFFPAYPLLARGLAGAFGISTEAGLLLAAQGAAWIAWVALAALIGAAGVSRRLAWGLLASAFVQPASFFLVAGYSESLFLAALLAWIAASEGMARNRAAALLAGLAGAVLTATRLVGVPALGVPWVALARRPGPGGRARALAWAALASTLGALGIGAFLVYSHAAHGRWDWYFRLQQAGWGNFPDYLVFLKPAAYLPRFFFEPTVDSLSRMAFPFSMAVFAYLIWRERRLARAGAADRGPARETLYYAAIVLLWVAAAGKANAKMDSMIRYALPVYWLQLVIFARLSAARSPATPAGRWVAPVVVGAHVLAWAAGVWLCARFVRGHWAA